jgi:3-hydroxyisobutyrate dehydrogenase-like beta-hydroxyacid dehydrogenase
LAINNQPLVRNDLARKDLSNALNHSKHLNVPRTLAVESDAIYQMLREKYVSASSTGDIAG